MGYNVNKHETSIIQMKGAIKSKFRINVVFSRGNIMEVLETDQINVSANHNV